MKRQTESRGGGEGWMGGWVGTFFAEFIVLSMIALPISERNFLVSRIS